MRPFVPFKQRHGAFPDEEYRRECEPTFTLDRQVAEARAEMGEARWRELQAEWDLEPPQVLKPDTFLEGSS